MHPLLHPNCHTQIVFSNINVKIEYQPLYEWLVWDYKNANSQSINKAIERLNWEKLIQNKNIQDYLKHLNEIIANTAHNYIPNKCITSNGKDLSWLNDHIKHLINQKNEIL